MSIFSKVRNTTKRVTKQSKFVKLNFNKLEKLAKQLNPKAIIDFYTYDGNFYFKGKNESLLNYVITLNAVNFGSGLSSEWKAKRKYKESSFKSVANALKQTIESGTALDMDFARNITKEQLAKMLDVDSEFKLVQMFRDSLNELGKFVYSEYGSYSNLISSLNPRTRANDLIMLLSSNLSCYKDIVKYNGFDVFFLKRAQILANDIYLAFDGKSYGEMEDIDELTMFADNLLPHFFKVNGVLEYTPELEDKIKNEIKIPSGSMEEIEIRAFAVQCVEELRKILSKQALDIKSAQIDYYIWEQSQSAKYKSIPRHKTVTYFY